MIGVKQVEIIDREIAAMKKAVRRVERGIGTQLALPACLKIFEALSELEALRRRVSNV